MTPAELAAEVSRLAIATGRSEAEVEFRLAWENETGRCHECVGTGEVFRSWHYRPCTRCDATGKARVAGRRA